MKQVKTIWELDLDEQLAVITGKLKSNITPEQVLALHRNTQKIDPRHTVETYAYWLENDTKVFEKRYVTKHGQWRVSALREGLTVDQWPLEDVLALVRGDIPVQVDATTDDSNIKRALKGSTGLSVELWHPKDIIAYAQTYHRPEGPVLPRVTDRGNPVRSLRYMVLAPGEWTRSEQLDGLDGKLAKQKEFDLDVIYESIVFHRQLPLEWSRDEIYNFLSNDVYPPKTSNGLWVNDVNRKHVVLEHLTLDAMQAFLLEEIDLQFGKTKICEEYRRRNGGQSFTDKIIVNQVRTMTRETKPSNVVYVTDMLQGFTDYMQKADGRNATTAAEAHHTMHALISKVVRMDFVEYNEAMGVILDYVYRNLTGVFAPGRVFGGISEVKLTSKQYAFYELYMNLILRTANPATRFEMAKQTDLTLLLKQAPVGDLSDKIHNFYKLDV